MDSPVITSNIEEQMKKLQGAIKLRFDRLGGEKSKIVRQQAGLLWRTFINLSFPNDPNKTKRTIASNVLRKFHEMSESESAHLGDARKSGSGDIVWTGAHSFALYGVAKDVDFRMASLTQLEQLYWGRGTQTRTAGRAKYPHGHGKQDVYVWQKISTDKRTVEELIRKWKSRVGALKAAFVPAWQQCGSPGGAVPGWILQNAPDGTPFEDNTMDERAPSFKAIVRAWGAHLLISTGKASAALRIRATACVRSLSLALHARGEDINSSFEE